VPSVDERAMFNGITLCVQEFNAMLRIMYLYSVGRGSTVIILYREARFTGSDGVVSIACCSYVDEVLSFSNVFIEVVSPLGLNKARHDCEILAFSKRAALR